MGSNLFTSGLISLETMVVALTALGLVGLGLLVWREWSETAQPAAVPAPSKAEFAAATALQLDKEAGAVLALVRTYLDAGERYSVSLAQAGESLPTSASPD